MLEARGPAPLGPRNALEGPRAFLSAFQPRDPRLRPDAPPPAPAPPLGPRPPRRQRPGRGAVPQPIGRWRGEGGGGCDAPGLRAAANPRRARGRAVTRAALLVRRRYRSERRGEQDQPSAAAAATAARRPLPPRRRPASARRVPNRRAAPGRPVREPPSRLRARPP